MGGPGPGTAMQRPRHADGGQPKNPLQSEAPPSPPQEERAGLPAVALAKEGERRPFGRLPCGYSFHEIALAQGWPDSERPALGGCNNPEGIESLSPGLADSERPTLGCCVRVTQP